MPRTISGIKMSELTAAHGIRLPEGAPVEASSRFHDDVATLRRELVGAKLVVRTTAGVYKLAGRSDARRRA